jgi:hypothetical protein
VSIDHAALLHFCDVPPARVHPTARLGSRVRGVRDLASPWTGPARLIRPG